jgi:hypothetical protein
VPPPFKRGIEGDFRGVVEMNDRILRRYKGIVKAINPIQFAIEVLKESENA